MRSAAVKAPIDGASSEGIRLRAMALGMVLCALIAVGLPYGEFVVKGTRLGLSSSTPAAFFLLFLLIAFVQPLLGLLRRAWLFNRAELLLITVMMMLTTAIPSRGLVGPLIPAISSILYYATPENNWSDTLLPFIPNWMIVHDEEAVKFFYEGLPRGEAIPWAAWLEPLTWWLLLLAAFYLVVLCAMVIMRRQWMDNERLLYPLMQVPLGMIEDSDPPSRFKPLLRNPVMWAGFAVPFLFNTVNALHRYYEFVPSVEINLAVRLAYDSVAIPIRLNYLMLGLAYFINTGLSFSMWFFYLLAKFQAAIFSYIGILTTEQIDAYSHAGPTTGMLSHQSMGAMIVLLLLGLWTARPHLRQVWQQVWKRRAGVDADELLSYRFAVIGLVAGTVFMVGWLWRSGLPLWAVLLYLFGAFVIFLALTRVIVEAGLSSAVEGMSGAGFLVSGVGSTALGPAGMMAAGFTLAWAGDLLIFMMAPCANGIRMLHGVKASKKVVLGMMAAAVVIGIAGSIYATLYMGYSYGALNLHRQYFSGLFALEPFRFASRFIESPTGPYWPGWIWTGVGAAIMAVLMTARHYLLWWPLHPIGYVVSGTWILNSIWFNIFLAWMIKAMVLKYAGPNGYRATRVFFLGVILGQFVVGGGWLITDGFTGMTGNTIRMY
jgi:hypothetical protein